MQLWMLITSMICLLQARDPGNMLVLLTLQPQSKGLSTTKTDGICPNLRAGQD